MCNLVIPINIYELVSILLIRVIRQISKLDLSENWNEIAIWASETTTAAPGKFRCSRTRVMNRFLVYLTRHSVHQVKLNYDSDFHRIQL